MIYRQTIQNLPETVLSNGGVGPVLPQITQLMSELKKARGNGAMPRFIDLPGKQDDLQQIYDIARRIRDNAEDVVILGTGGSSLGAQTLVALKGLRFAEKSARPRLHFPDNLGPHTMEMLLDDLDMGKTHFIVVSKSGTTAETLAQMMACLAAVRQVKEQMRLSDHFTVVVQSSNNVLRRFCRRWRLPMLDHDPELGGRYSALSVVGLLPAAVAGLDIQAFRDGAAEVVEQAFSANDLNEIPAVSGATAIYGLIKGSGMNVSVLMPYDSRLARFTGWFQQLWAESLGKDGHGTTPVAALGPVDQHSQLQLFLDGPADKFFTFLTADMKGLGPVIDASLASDPELGYMSGRTIGDLVAAEARATMEALVRRGRPVRHISVKKLDEYSLGAMMMHFMLETIFAAALFEVNPYDQPSVEESKRLTRDYLEREFGRMPGQNR